MKSTSKTSILTALVVLTLLLMHKLPTFSINGMETRPVDLLSELRPENEPAETPLQPIPAPHPKKEKSRYTPYHPKGVVLIEDFSNGKEGGMSHFYDKLASPAGQRHVNIAYFGDSFIEGDITTCDLRDLLQAKFGGSGPGWVDCGGGLASIKPTIGTKFSNIKEYMVTKKPFDTALQGISQKYYVPTAGATLTLTGTKFRPRNAQWNKATLYFRTSGGLTVQTSMNGQDYETETFDGMAAVQAAETTGDMSRISYKFAKTAGSTQLLGVTLDGASGVALDNFSMRGSAGFTLASIPLTTLQEIGKHRTYDLIIIHFGLNVVTNNSTDAQCKAYTKRMKKVVDLMHEAFPHASILVFGVSDRVQRSAGGFQTLKGIERLMVAQRQLAEECGVGYLSIFDCMGGRNSMKKFVDDGLAAKDYTHMNFKGGKVIAEHIYQSILAGMENRKRQKAAEQ